MIYLIDFENVRSLKGISAHDEDCIILFYTQNADSIKLDDLQEIRKSNANIELKKVSAGKNALDFQLSSYVGYLIGSSNNDFCVVSNDNGFDAIVNFWKNEKGITIKRQKSLGATANNTAKNSEQSIGVDNNPIDKNGSDLATALKNSKLGFADEQIKKTIDIVSKYKTKSAINNNLQQYFKDNNLVGNIHKVLKPYLKGKK